MAPINRARVALCAALIVGWACDVVLSQNAAWTVGPWSDCSRPCGTGVRQRSVACADRATGKTLVAGNCTGVPEQVFDDCNTDACPATNVRSLSGGPTDTKTPMSFRNGGDVTVTIVEARNLPNLDGWGVFGGSTDAYVQAAVLDVKGNTILKRQSAVVSNSVNPVWPNGGSVVRLGTQDTGTPVQLTLLNYNTGLLGASDVIGQVLTNVIACSFNRGLSCAEATWLPLVPGRRCYAPGNGTVPAEPLAGEVCMKVVYTVIAHQLDIKSSFTSRGDLPIDLALPFPNDGTPYNGCIYAGDNTKVSASFYNFRDAYNGLILRTRSADHNTFTGPVYATFTSNLEADVFVFKHIRDTKVNLRWLQQAPWSHDQTVRMATATASPSTDYYECWRRHIAAGEVVALGGPNNAQVMYVVVVRMADSVDVVVVDPHLPFARLAFLSLLAEFGIPWAILMGIVVHFMHTRLRWQLDLIPSYLTEKQLPQLSSKAWVEINKKLGLPNMDHKYVHLLASAFISHLKTKDNIKTRRALFYMTMIIRMLIASPFIVSFAYGIACVASVPPRSVGFGIMFIASSFSLGVFSVGAWNAQGWRMTRGVLLGLFLSFMGLFLFLLCAVYADVLPTSLFSITAVMLSLNMIPMVAIAFINDRHLRAAYTKLASVAAKNAALIIAQQDYTQAGASAAAGAEEAQEEDDELAVIAAKGGMRRKVRISLVESKLPWLTDMTQRIASDQFRALVGDSFSISKGVFGGAFSLVDAYIDIFTMPKGKQLQLSKRLYGFAALTLLTLAIMSWADDQIQYNSSGFATGMTTVTLDSAAFLLHRGEVSWTPGYTLLLMGSSRALIALFVGEHWLAGHSLAYFVWGIALGLEIVGRRLRLISLHEAASIAYFGDTSSVSTDVDIAGAPEFVLGYITFFFGMLLLGAIFATDGPQPAFTFVGAVFPVWVFGIAALMLALIIGLLSATMRAYLLEKRRLLHTVVFLYFGEFTLPFMLAAVTEVMVITCGILMYAITGSSVIIVCAIFLPIIFVLGVRVFGQWARNDFDLTQDPKLRVTEVDEWKADLLADADPTAGDGAGGGGGSGGYGADGTFSLPPLVQNDGDDGAAIAMPMLPVAGASAKPKPPPPREPPAGAAAATAATPDGGAEVVPAAEGALPAAGDGSAPLADGTALEGGAVVALPDVKKVVLAKAPRKPLKLRWQEWKALVSDPLEMHPSRAFIMGKLTRTDYVTLACLAGLSTLIFIMGIVLASVNSPSWVGHVVWTGAFVCMGFGLPVIKYFNTYKITRDMIAAVVFAYVLLTSTSWAIFAVLGNSDPNSIVLLYVFCVWMLVPIVFVVWASLWKWKDMGYSAGPARRISASMVRAKASEALWRAASLGDVNAMNNVIKNADMNWLNPSCLRLTTPLMEAAIGGHLEAVRLLLNAGADGGMLNDIGYSASMYAMRANQTGVSETIDSWVETHPMRGADKAAKTEDAGSAVIVQAAKYGRLQTAAAVASAFWIVWLDFVIFGWVSIYAGFGFMLFAFAATFLLFLLSVWASNENFLPPNYRKAADWLMFSLAWLGIIVGLFGDVDLFYCFSISFLFMALRHSARAVGTIWSAPPYAPVYFSQFIFPMYRYSPDSNDLVNANKLGIDVAIAVGVFFLWGAFAIMFYVPIEVGFGIATASLAFIVILVAHVLAATPLRLGASASFMDEQLLAYAGKQARTVFTSRRKRLLITCDEFDARDKRGAELEAQLNKYKDAAQRNKEGRADWDSHRHTAAYLASKIADTYFFLNYVPKVPTLAPSHSMRRMNIGAEDGADVEATPLLGGEGGGGGAAAGAGAASDDPTFAALEGFKPPVEVVAPKPGACARLCTRCSAVLARFRVVRKRQATGDDGTPKSMRMAQRRADAMFTLADVWTDIWNIGDGPLGWLCCRSLPHSLYDLFCTLEGRNRRHGGAYVRGEPEVTAGGPPMQDSLGILAGLREAMYELSREYYEEMRCTMHFETLVLVAAEARIRTEAVLFQKFLREYRFKLMANGVQPPAEIFKTQSYATVDVQLVATWLCTLTPEQQQRFRQLKERFSGEVDGQYQYRLLKDAEAEEEAFYIVQRRRPVEQTQFQKRWKEFQRRRIARRKAGRDNADVTEDIMNGMEAYDEIEKAGLHTEPGHYGRAKQYSDPEFTHDDSSVGAIEKAELVQGWRVSQGININATLFKNGTDPDDVFQGQLNDGWLLSALSIVAASGGVGDDSVDELIDQLFPLKQTSDTGMYMVRLWKNAQWETVVVDDFFPVLDNKFKPTKCAGAAFAYAPNFEKLWVALLEKAFAKYHGGYAALETGTVPMGLTDITGGPSEEIFLAEASRGANKIILWNTLRKLVRNKFLLGAGTVVPSSTEKELLDSGLVFGACYVVYDVRDIDGLRLLKLRNPPGDHGEWKGDWGDDSPLWTKRLKILLGWSAADDGTFWMSFDDFCLSFRSLYVCRVFPKERWHKSQVSGWWTGSLAAGLPCRHNPDCKVESNPQYSLVVTRPTDIAITLRQSLPDKILDNNPHPIAVMIVAQPGAEDYTARNKTERELVLAALGGDDGNVDIVGGIAKAYRVRTLTSINVVASSGRPLRAREVQLFVSLPPRAYTILVATYTRGMVGPYTLTLHSNFEVELGGLWPPPKDVAKPPVHLQRIKEWQAKLKVPKQLSVALATAAEWQRHFRENWLHDHAMLDREATAEADEVAAQQAWAELAEQEIIVEREQATMANRATSSWVEQYDPASDRKYFYNMETAQSQWDQPAEWAAATAAAAEAGASESKAGPAAAGGAALGTPAAADKKKKKTKKKDVDGSVCGICQKQTIKGQKDDSHPAWNKFDRSPRDLIKCSRGCGAEVHPVCAGFTDDRPPPTPWVCPLCQDDG